MRRLRYHHVLRLIIVSILVDSISAFLLPGTCPSFDTVQHQNGRNLVIARPPSSPIIGSATPSAATLSRRRHGEDVITLAAVSPAKEATAAAATDSGEDFLQRVKKGNRIGKASSSLSSVSSLSSSPIGLEDIVKNLHERTWASLDLHVVQKRLAGLCDTGRAKELALSPHFAEDVEEVHQRYKAVKEVWASFEVIPVNHPMDIAAAVAFASRGNVLEIPELRDIAKTLSVMSTLKSFFDMQPEMTMPQLKAYSNGIDLPQELLDLLTDAFDNEGRLSGDKFPQLKRLRAEIERLYGSIKNTVGDLMKSQGMSTMITDEYIAQRNGRFVLPIKNTFKRSGLGIVHDQSNTGRTVYVEPVQVIEPTNDMKRMELELQQEEARIISEMTRLIAISKDKIMKSLDSVALIDISVARAGLGDVMNAVVPEVGSDGAISAQDARHPVLVLRDRDPVGNTLHIDPEKPGLVLTGPNAGGKTIVLKTLGLLALLVRLGIPLPASRGVRVDFFSPILADIGDMQSVTGDLSTFSGHLLVCREVLYNAASGALVLMDEMGSGTDPAQGVAIAQALLEALLETGARVAITTHYMQLKELAQVDDRFTVGAMEFLDGTPTYRFREGAIGESYALEVAEQLELPRQVLDRARTLMDQGVVKVTELIKELEAQRDVLQGEIDAAIAREKELTKEKMEMDKKMKELEDQQVELDRLRYRAKLETAETFMAQLTEKEKKLEQLMRNVGFKDKASVQEALKELGNLKAEVQQETKPEVKHVPAHLVLLKRDDILKEDEIVTCAGDELNANRSGKVVKVSGQNVDVMFSRAGLDIIVTFKKTELARALQDVVEKMKPKPKKKEKRWTKADERNLKMLGDEMGKTTRAVQSGAMKAIRTSFNTIDCRGQRLREAETKVDAFLKTGVPQNQKVAYVLHGHGTGQLKEGLREFLKRHPYVASSRPADDEDGGDAFTICRLK